MKINKDNTSRNILTWTIKNRLFILISIALSTVAGVIYSFASQPKYQRELSVMMLSDIYGNSQINELITFSYWDINKTGIDVFNEIEVFRSPILMEKVVKKLNLNITYTKQRFAGNIDLYKKSPIIVEFIKPVSNFNGERVSSISFDIKATNKELCHIKKIRLNNQTISEELDIKTGEITETPMGKIKVTPTKDFSIYKNTDINIKLNPSEIIANTLSKKITAKIPNPKSTVINLSITDTNPQRAEDILNTLLTVYNEEWINHIKESYNNTSQFIETQLNRLESELHLDKRVGLQQKSSMTDSETLFSVNNQLLVTKYIKNYIAEQTDNIIPTNLGLQNDTLCALINEYNTIISTKKQITDSKNSNKTKLSDINNKLENKRTEILYNIEKNINTLNFQAKTIEEDDDELACLFGSDSKDIKEIMSLEREEQTKKAFYNYLLNKLEENKLSSSLIVNNTRLLKPATGEEEPIYPKKVYIILFAFLTGIAIPYGYKYLTDVFTL